MEDPAVSNNPAAPRNAGFYAILAIGFVVLVGATTLAFRGLPGLSNSPTATVDGKSVIGKTGN
jgi:hypothetical protein